MPVNAPHQHLKGVCRPLASSVPLVGDRARRDTCPMMALRGVTEEGQ